jgi:tRNA(Ile)-lysidine synthetase-like protein
LLLNLLRGAGVQGLAAMPVWKDRHYRPLLHTPYPTLQAYAATHGLKFIEDPHNQDPRYTRSFLRQHVLPALRERYASLDTRFAHSSQHCAEAALLLAECYQQDAVWQPSWSCEWPVNEPAQALSLPPLLALPLHRQKNVLRHAARQQAESLNESALAALLKLIQHPTPAAVVPWGKHEARVFKQALYFLPQASPDYLAAAVAAQQGGIARLPNQDGGDRVKKALQALGVPSWARPRLPLLWNGERYVAVWLGQWVRF